MKMKDILSATDDMFTQECYGLIYEEIVNRFANGLFGILKSV